VHKSCPELKRGSLKFIDSNYNFLAYGRFNAKARSLVLINNSEGDIDREISVWELGVPKESVLVCQIYTDEHGHSDVPKEYLVISGKINVHMPKFSAMVLRHKDDEPGEIQDETLDEMPDYTELMTSEKKKEHRFSWFR